MAVVIFGATSRIARELALRFAERGNAICVAGRDAGEIDAIANDIAVRTGVRAIGRVFDAADPASHPALVANIEAELGPLTAAVVAFGDMGDQKRAEADPEHLQRVLVTNFVGAATLLEALAAPMASRGKGALVVIGSVAGDRGRQSNYAYGSAKAGLEAFVGGLRNRLFRRGVHVLLVKPGFIDTRMTWGLETRIPIASPEALSRAVIEALDRKADTLYHPAFWRLVMGVIRTMPEAVFKRLSL
jgi:decaprenylphospho-beta-D-erythro-pentofuranosid-2-ulose 2-reductase